MNRPPWVNPWVYGARIARPIFALQNQGNQNITQASDGSTLTTPSGSTILPPTGLPNGMPFPCVITNTNSYGCYWGLPLQPVVDITHIAAGTVNFSYANTNGTIAPHPVFGTNSLFLINTSEFTDALGAGNSPTGDWSAQGNILVIGTVVMVYPTYSTVTSSGNLTQQISYLISQVPMVVPVELSKTGGNNGNTGSTPQPDSYQYTMACQGTTLATMQTQTAQHLNLGNITAGTSGLAIYNTGSGTNTYELSITDACPAQGDTCST